VISVIIPTLNAEARLAACLASVYGGSGQNPCEVIVADGGSRDRTREISAEAGTIWVDAPRGRARQMNAGAERATGQILLFLHADTVLEAGWPAAVTRAAAAPGFRLGAFKLRFAHRGLAYRLIEFGVSLRCRYRHGPYGDQALFVRRDDFEGYPDIPIMEDVELVRRHGPARLIDKTATTSADRFARDGALRRSRRNRETYRRYAAGATPEELLPYYLDERRRVCVFCKRPVAGKVKTRLANGVDASDGAVNIPGIGPERAVRLYSKLVEYTVAQVDASSAKTVVHFDPPEAQAVFEGWLEPTPGSAREFRPQVPGDLGARLLDAFGDHGRGTSTVVIGTDCPGLTSAHLDQAFAALHSADLVLGPTADGGYYLLGAREPFPQLFEDMPWSTEQVLAETLARAAAAGLRVAQLARLRDLDTSEDLAALQGELKSAGIDSDS